VTLVEVVREARTTGQYFRRREWAEHKAVRVVRGQLIESLRPGDTVPVGFWGAMADDILATDWELVP